VNYDSPGIEGCWARPGIVSFADLKGKKVAANTSAEITLNGLLAAHGMTIKDVSYLNLPPTEMAGAISKSDVDAAGIWEPLLDGIKQAVPSGKMLGTDMLMAGIVLIGVAAAGLLIAGATVSELLRRLSMTPHAAIRPPSGA
jgi:ABC-type nitrate/sulfonate/bicarbonate transport system substrate-binding protein